MPLFYSTICGLMKHIFITKIFMFHVQCWNVNDLIVDFSWITSLLLSFGIFAMLAQMMKNTHPNFEISINLFLYIKKTLDSCISSSMFNFHFLHFGSWIFIHTRIVWNFTSRKTHSPQIKFSIDFYIIKQFHP